MNKLGFEPPADYDKVLNEPWLEEDKRSNPKKYGVTAHLMITAEPLAILLPLDSLRKPK